MREPNVGEHYRGSTQYSTEQNSIKGDKEIHKSFWRENLTIFSVEGIFTTEKNLVS